MPIDLIITTCSSKERQRQQNVLLLKMSLYSLSSQVRGSVVSELRESYRPWCILDTCTWLIGILAQVGLHYGLIRGLCKQPHPRSQTNMYAY